MSEHYIAETITTVVGGGGSEYAERSSRIEISSLFDHKTWTPYVTQEDIISGEKGCQLDLRKV